MFDGGAGLEAIERVSALKADVLFGGVEALLDESLLVNRWTILAAVDFACCRLSLNTPGEVGRLWRQGRRSATGMPNSCRVCRSGRRRAHRPRTKRSAAAPSHRARQFPRSPSLVHRSRQPCSGIPARHRAVALLVSGWGLFPGPTMARRAVANISGRRQERRVRAHVMRAASSLALQQTDFPRAMDLGLEALRGHEARGD